MGASVAGPTEQQEAGATGNAEMGRESGKAMTRKKVCILLYTQRKSHKREIKWGFASQKQCRVFPRPLSVPIYWQMKCTDCQTVSYSPVTYSMIMFGV